MSKSNRIKIYVDGSSDFSNAGYGIFDKTHSRFIFEAIPGHWQSHEIEMIALCKAIEYIIDNQMSHVVIHTDCKANLLERTFDEYLLQHDIVISWLQREQNGTADRLANMGRMKAHNQFANNQFFFTTSISERYSIFSKLDLSDSERNYLDALYGLNDGFDEITDITSNNIRFIHSTIGVKGRKSLKGRKYWLNHVQKLEVHEIDSTMSNLFSA